MTETALPRRVAALSAAIAGVLGAWLLVLHARMVVSTAPQEMREGATVWITRLLLEGRNPYALGELPASTNVYGILYHWVVLPFAWLFGNSFLIHRLISGVAILGASALMHRMLRRERTEPVLAFVGTLLFYASSLYFVAPVARPDGLGLLLSALSMTWLFNDTLTPLDFACGLTAALLALMTKLYFAFPPFVMAAYVFLYISRPRGLIYAVVTLASCVALLLALSTSYPAYITMSLIANLQTSYTDSERLIGQTIDWLVFSLPLTVALAIVLFQQVTGARSLHHWRARPSVFTFASAVNAAVFLYWLGWHPGAHMTYLFQLVTPVLLLAVFPRLGGSGWPRAVVTAALPFAFLLNAHYFPTTFARFRAAEASFGRLQAAIDAHQRVLGATEVAGLLALANRPVVDSGQSEYFREAIPDRDLPAGPPAAALRKRWDGFVDQMVSDIGERHFDLVIRSRRNGLIPLDVLGARYRAAGAIDVDFVWAGQTWPVDLWEPTPAEAPGAAPDHR